MRQNKECEAYIKYFFTKYVYSTKRFSAFFCGSVSKLEIWSNMTSTCGGIRYSLPIKLSKLMLYRSESLIRVETSGSDLPASQLVYVERTTFKWWATSFWVNLFFLRKYTSRSLSNDYSPPFLICDNYKRTREVDGIYLDKTINYETFSFRND